MTTANPAQPEPSSIPPAAAIANAVASATPKVDAPPAVDPVKAAVAEALRLEREAVADKAAKDKEAADAEAAKQRGEWEKVAKANEAKAIEAERLLAIQRADTLLTDHLAAEHPELLTKKKWITPHIDKTLTGQALIDATTKAVADFVKENPPVTKPGGAGVPAHSGSRIPQGRAGSENPGLAYARSRYTGPAKRV